MILASQIYHFLHQVSNWLSCWPYLDIVRRFCLSGDDVIKLDVVGVLVASSVFQILHGKEHVDSPGF